MKPAAFKALLFIILFLALSSSNSFAQAGIGKIFGKDEAHKLYGPVHHSFTINPARLEALLNKAGSSILFGFLDGSLYILDSKRNIIFTSGQYREIGQAEVFKLYSVSVVKDLLGRGKDSAVHIEKREGVISVTSGEYTMESATDCPPFCVDPK